jgi:hypothetical protein
MEKHTLRRLGAQLRKEIVPLEDLPFPMREALRKLAEKYDGCPTASNDDEQNCEPTNHDTGGRGQPRSSSMSKE